MSRKPLVYLFLLIAVMRPLGLAAQEHQHGSESTVRFGAQVVGLGTRATPAELGKDLTEFYLTQPAISVMASGWQDRLRFTGMLNLEGRTLKRGELTHSAWGEGYIDRRHPHTYLHEAVASIEESALGFDFSLSAGKGFAPFGTDDPMVRPFVKYPSNHHLSQVLERLVGIAAVRRGGVVAEFGLFNGDEPTRPRDNGTLDRFGDSWAGRITLLPTDWLELQGSLARLESPERPGGGGLDQRKRSVSARVAGAVGENDVYALIEHARTAEVHGDEEVFVFTSFLAEASASREQWSLSLRYENTTRPEEERLESIFRSVRPTTDNSILGTTRWQTWTAAVARDVELYSVRMRPFLEVSRAHAKPGEAFPVYRPEELFGDDDIWSFSAGLRLAIGMQHNRMGRYGAAVN